MIFLTADLHLGHRNIIKYCNRPFRGTWEMDEVLVSNILETVGKKDTLYILGDLTLNKKIYYSVLERLSELEVIVLRGNHDHDKSLPLALEIKDNHKHFYLCHFPWETWAPMSYMLHGHSHGRSTQIPLRYDVGVDVEWDGRRYFPVSLDQVMRKGSKPPHFSGVSGGKMKRSAPPRGKTPWRG